MFRNIQYNINLFYIKLTFRNQENEQKATLYDLTLIGKAEKPEVKLPTSIG